MRTRNEILEKQYKRRYNRIVEININSQSVSQTNLSVKSSKGTEYNIVEFRKEGLTEYALLKIKGKTYRYPRYIDAEIHMADLIGEEEDGNAI